MRIIAALIALATPGLAFAVEPNPKATLTCEVVEKGGRTKLPAKRIRIEEPVEWQGLRRRRGAPRALRGAPRHHLDRLRGHQSGCQKI